METKERFNLEIWRFPPDQGVSAQQYIRTTHAFGLYSEGMG